MDNYPSPCAPDQKVSPATPASTPWEYKRYGKSLKKTLDNIGKVRYHNVHMHEIRRDRHVSTM
jgi:hypothetical protein